MVDFSAELHNFQAPRHLGIHGDIDNPKAHTDQESEHFSYATGPKLRFRSGLRSGAMSLYEVLALSS